MRPEAPRRQAEPSVPSSRSGETPFPSEGGPEDLDPRDLGDDQDTLDTLGEGGLTRREKGDREGLPTPSGDSPVRSVRFSRASSAERRAQPSVERRAPSAGASEGPRAPSRGPPERGAYGERVLGGPPPPIPSALSEPSMEALPEGTTASADRGRSEVSLLLLQSMEKLEASARIAWQIEDFRASERERILLGLHGGQAAMVAFGAPLKAHPSGCVNLEKLSRDVPPARLEEAWKRLPWVFSWEGPPSVVLALTWSLDRGPLVDSLEGSGGLPS